MLSTPRKLYLLVSSSYIFFLLYIYLRTSPVVPPAAGFAAQLLELGLRIRREKKNIYLFYKIRLLRTLTLSGYCCWKG
jgi:hypothetical protein